MSATVCSMPYLRGNLDLHVVGKPVGAAANGNRGDDEISPGQQLGAVRAASILVGRLYLATVFLMYSVTFFRRPSCRSPGRSWNRAATPRLMMSMLSRLPKAAASADDDNLRHVGVPPL